MPRRSSRSSPASRISLRDPTGSASLAMAMGGRLSTPVPGLADAAQSLLRLRVAERTRDAGLVEGARVEAEAGRDLVVARQIGVEHRRVVRRDRAADAGRDEPRQRVIVEARDRAGPEVRERAHVEHRPARDRLADESVVLLDADPVPEPVGLQVLERAADARGAGHLARVRDRAEPERLRVGEDLLVRLGRELGLEAAETDADDAALAVPRAPVDGLTRLLEREAARDVGRQADLDAVQVLRLLRTVADALEDVLPGAAVPDALGGAEDPLEVDGAVPRRLGRVVDDHLPVVLFLLQRVRREDPDLDEVPEVGEPVELLQPFDRRRRQRVVVPPRDLEERVRADRPLEVDVQLDLRIVLVPRTAPLRSAFLLGVCARSARACWRRYLVGPRPRMSGAA